ncbi:hypothetical protein NRY95_01365 [Xanthomonas campestris pv. phormiicola]|nr:hypothetical protein [Xanthomonas campestris pv. phormiicola]UYC16661.1 hypothetical protein NRY95_01365 [Xanthomonas campestris pv. phormiicola]
MRKNTADDRLRCGVEPETVRCSSFAAPMFQQRRDPAAHAGDDAERIGHGRRASLRRPHRSADAYAAE